MEILKDEIQRVHKKEVARRQLETAVFLFLKGIDYSSVVTLAGAAGNILLQLVLNRGERPFVDLGRDVANYLQGELLPRKRYKYRMQILFGIIPLKHMSDKCDEIVEMDLEKCALSALTVAVCDYTTLSGQNEPFVKAFLNWCWKNQNGPQVMEEYQSLPKKLKK
ncbi:MAG: hypothetical protein KAQ98_04740 [Bacteriovoracaceae bacterium]|nr:hypothetical protein [Bacteriovoracaceae bacterium]